MSARRLRKTNSDTNCSHSWVGSTRLQWSEQENYEVIRPLVLFGESVVERSEQTGVSEHTLYRRVGGFEREGMESLFSVEKARRKKLPPATRRLIVDLKAEYPTFNSNERTLLRPRRTQSVVEFGRTSGI